MYNLALCQTKIGSKFAERKKSSGPAWSALITSTPLNNTRETRLASCLFQFFKIQYRSGKKLDLFVGGRKGPRKNHILRLSERPRGTQIQGLFWNCLERSCSFFQSYFLANLPKIFGGLRNIIFTCYRRCLADVKMEKV